MPCSHALHGPLQSPHAFVMIRSMQLEHSGALWWLVNCTELAESLQTFAQFC